MHLNKEVKMTDSILDSTKEKLLLMPDDTSFDDQIIAAINTAFFRLKQVGSWRDDLFTIEDNSSKWSECTDRTDILPAIQAYVWLCARLEFDPPQSSILMDAYTKQKDELEWRLSIE